MHAAPRQQTSEYTGARVTNHAWQRMRARSLSDDAVLAALDHGRVVHVRGAEIHAIGRREVEQCRQAGVDLSGLEGVQVVCSSDGIILTVYRNRDFRGLRPRRPRRSHQR